MQMSGETGIGQLDFNMPEPLVLNRDKPAPDVSGSSLLPSSFRTQARSAWERQVLVKQAFSQQESNM